jgi:hypothetical protein
MSAPSETLVKTPAFRFRQKDTIANLSQYVQMTTLRTTKQHFSFFGIP